MISGTVSDDGVPIISLEVGGRSYIAIVDTGFDGDLELPEQLRAELNPLHIGRVASRLAGGQVIQEEAYHVDFLFDGETVQAETSFVPGDGILVGRYGATCFVR